MSEAYLTRLSEDYGHALMNPFGDVICVSKITLRMLDMKGYLRRDRKSGLKQFKPEHVDIFLELERTTYHRELYAALGPEFTGPAAVTCPCRECREKINLDDSRISDIRTSQIVSDVKLRRRKIA